MASPHWPRVPAGTRTYRVPAHPAVCWLSRVLARVGVRLDPWIEGEEPMFRDQDPVWDWGRGTVFCSPAQYEQLARAIRQGSDR